MNWNEILRDTWQTSLVFLSLLVFTRILGKTQVGQLTFYEYISGITIGSIAANIASSEPDKVWSHYYDLVLFICLTYLLSVLTIKSRPMRKMIEGSPTIVIRDGQILNNHMHGMRYDLDELNGQLRQKGIFDPSEVQYAILETNGDLSVIKKADYQPLTKADVGISAADPAFPVELIMDGQIIERNLRRKNRNKTWLEHELIARGFKDASQIEYAVIDSTGKIFISPKEKQSNNQ